MIIDSEKFSLILKEKVEKYLDIVLIECKEFNMFMSFGEIVEKYSTDFGNDLDDVIPENFSDQDNESGFLITFLDNFTFDFSKEKSKQRVDPVYCNIQRYAGYRKFNSEDWDIIRDSFMRITNNVCSWLNRKVGSVEQIFSREEVHREDSVQGVINLDLSNPKVVRYVKEHFEPRKIPLAHEFQSCFYKGVDFCLTHGEIIPPPPVYIIFYDCPDHLFDIWGTKKHIYDEFMQNLFPDTSDYINYLKLGRMSNFY